MSIIIPVRGETYEVEPGVSILKRMVQDIYAKASGEIEVIVIFDGEPYQELPSYPNLICLPLSWSGTKMAVNAGARFATGKYLLKMDAHCMVAEGFDEALQTDIENNWVVMPRMFILDAEHWQFQDGRFYDYFFLPCPFTYKRGFAFQAGGHWKDRTHDKVNLPIDENMKLHGSCWFMTRDYYWDYLGGLDPYNGAGRWNGEDIEISLKTWLGPWEGRVMVNKKTWFAHMHRGSQRPREWKVDYKEAYRSAGWTAEYWMGNKWEKRSHDIEWLVDKFWPVPGWPDNWKEYDRP